MSHQRHAEHPISDDCLACLGLHVSKQARKQALSSISASLKQISAEYQCIMRAVVCMLQQTAEP